MELKDLGAFLKKEGINLEEQVANIQVSDSDISGGRKIVDAKSNQLFTGRFEEKDVNDFKRIWSQYRSNNLGMLKNQLIRNCKSMVLNYHGEVCPIEVMLYTSNIISSSFSNFKLAEEIADVIYLVWKENNEFISSIEHIVTVWRWDHVINICAIAVGKICADVSNDDPIVDLLHSIFDSYRYNDVTRQGCFMGVLASKKEEFVPDILNVVHDLTGTDADKVIGNLFKNKFFMNFLGYYNQLNAEMFADSSPYARELVRKILDNGAKDGTLVGRYQKATSKVEKQEIIEESLQKIKHGQGQGVYDAVNVLKLCGSTEVNEKMYQMMQTGLKRGHSASVLPTISYFGSINYSVANKDMKGIGEESEYYSACQVALFKQGVISSDELMARFLSETRPKQIKNYLTGFGGLSDKVSEVKNSTFTYFSRNLKDTDLKCAIGNYEKLIRKYKHLYNPQVGELFKELFGYGTVFGIVQIRMTEQNACLNIIEMIIDSANCKKYEDFLYYVAEQGINFGPTITSHAREILRNINSERIKI